MELAKHNLLINDIIVHQTSIETLKRAGRLLIVSDHSCADAGDTQQEVDNLNSRCNQLQHKLTQRQAELGKLFKEAQLFMQEVQEWFMWLQDVHDYLVFSKPVGGGLETAREQVHRFVKLFNEIYGIKHKAKSVLQHGQDCVRHIEGSQTTER